MCGIFCCFNRGGDISQYRARAIACSKRQRHRGPDWSGCYMTDNTVLVHERLAIVGVGKSMFESFLFLREEDLESLAREEHISA